MIPDHILQLRPMLAEDRPGVAPADLLSELQDTGDWMFEHKVNGHRCLASVTDGRVLLRTREGRDITLRFPEVTAALGGFFPAHASVVLDGELACLEEGGRQSLRKIQGRASRTTGLMRAVRDCPVTLITFDVLFVNGNNTYKLPYDERKRVLNKITSRWERSEWKGTLQSVYSTHDGLALWDVVQSRGDEGIVAKRLRSLYHAGSRSRDWLKVK